MLSRPSNLKDIWRIDDVINWYYPEKEDRDEEVEPPVQARPSGRSPIRFLRRSWYWKTKVLE